MTDAYEGEERLSRGDRIRLAGLLGVCAVAEAGAIASVPYGMAIDSTDVIMTDAFANLISLPAVLGFGGGAAALLIEDTRLSRSEHSIGEVAG